MMVAWVRLAILFLEGLFFLATCIVALLWDGDHTEIEAEEHCPENIDVGGPLEFQGAGKGCHKSIGRGKCCIREGKHELFGCQGLKGWPSGPRFTCGCGWWWGGHWSVLGGLAGPRGVNGQLRS